MAKRFFTVEQARQLLPRVQELVEAAMALSRALEQNREEVQGLADRSGFNAGSATGTDHVHSLLLLKQCVQHLEDMGCIVKSLQDGLVDFPHLREGREVYLCWKYGESDIMYWHEVDAGFAGRTPLG